jgi:hypothetical protein
MRGKNKKGETTVHPQFHPRLLYKNQYTLQVL